MLERITDFFSHPDLIFGADHENDPQERFIRVLAYYLSGWHIKAKGVKKPYNPVLGEFFRCTYKYPDGSTGFYVAEQVSHHPPISAYFYVSPANKVRITGELKPKSKFLGNSVCTIMEGENRVQFTGRPDDGEYVITMPNMYARGIVFGRMVLELGDTCSAKCQATGMSAELDFKTKGFFSGTYNAIEGKVKSNDHDVGEVTGRWSHAMEFKAQNGAQRVLFNAHDKNISMAQKDVVEINEQEPNESRCLWQHVTNAIIANDMDAATESKTSIEDAQREARKQMEDSHSEHEPKFFVRDGDRWVPKLASLSETMEEALAQIEHFIWP